MTSPHKLYEPDEIISLRNYLTYCFVCEVLGYVCWSGLFLITNNMAKLRTVGSYKPKSCHLELPFLLVINILCIILFNAHNPQQVVRWK